MIDYIIYLHNKRATCKHRCTFKRAFIILEVGCFIYHQLHPLLSCQLVAEYLPTIIVQCFSGFPHHLKYRQSISTFGFRAMSHLTSTHLLEPPLLSFTCSPSRCRYFFLILKMAGLSLPCNFAKNRVNQRIHMPDIFFKLRCPYQQI